MIMTNLLILALSFTMLFGNFVSNNNSASTMETETINFDISTLTPSGQEAFKALHEARVFENTHVGIAGLLSQYVVAFGVLLKEKDADAAFKAILKNGTNAGQLYALGGLYFTDHEYFNTAVTRYRNNENVVMEISGCIVFDKTMSEIVESNSKNVAIIKPTEKIEDFWKSNTGNYKLDISHGGYPATFKYFAEKTE